MIFEQIRANRRRSVVLVTTLVLVLLLMGVAVGEAFLPGGGGVLGLLLALIILLVQMGIYFGAARSLILHGANAVELQRDDNPRLYNIVEEMKIASGLPYMPRVYLIDDPAPNAFAFGRGPKDSSVAVTTGLLQRLNRDELQGVIAHEIGHLVNQDVKFMTLAAVMLGSVVILSEVIWRSALYGGRARTRSRSRSGGGGGQAQIIILVVALLFAVLGPLLAYLLYFACSRKREYLADASAAQYTRYPEGLAAALEKISRAPDRVAFANKTTAPMFIVNPLQTGQAAVSAFATHPPTSERVRILRNMSAAGLGDYDAAFRQATGQSLLSAPVAGSVEIRAPSPEPATEIRRAPRSTVHRHDGYVPVHCACGLQTAVPEGHASARIRCVRCGAEVAVPQAQPAPPVLTATVPPLLYHRQTAGWESFRCQCGRTIQLSPGFAAPQVRCGSCGTTIAVAS